MDPFASTRTVSNAPQVGLGQFEIRSKPQSLLVVFGGRREACVMPVRCLIDV